VDVLKSQSYQFGLFSGDNFSDSLYQETIFRGMPLSKAPFDPDTTADEQTIQRWANWVSDKSGSPWFGFLELTTVDNFSNYADSNSKASATEKLRNNYHHSVNVADQELGLLFAKLQEMELLDKTVVVITSNHGTEFNETKTNSWGANSNYSRYQLQVPMVIHWPGKIAATFTHRSSHLDLSVTLLQDLLGVSSNPNDFSSGRNLFNENKRKWILAGDSRELALITDKDTTVIDKFGNFKLFDDNYQRLKDANPTLPILMQGLTELQRFYSKDN
jgi:membrane-anchored protein YejM (alkaline phosphatase superfamily)